MAPVKPVTIEDILKDMRKKNKKKISQKNNTNKNGTVSAKMVELVERNKKENGEMKMEVGEKGTLNLSIEEAKEYFSTAK